jgi:hypothetical protein
VNALRHVHQLLGPDGTLLDLHPVTEQQVEAGGTVVGTIREPEWVDRHLPNAEAGLQQVIGEGLYVLEAEVDFDVLQHFDTTDELTEKAADLLAAQPALDRRIRDTPPPFVLRERVVLRRLRALAQPGRRSAARRASRPCPRRG